MLSRALRSQTKKLSQYWELLGIIGPSISPLRITRVLKTLMKKWVPAYWQPQSFLRRLRDPLHWGMEESVKTLAQELLSLFFFFFCKWKPPKMKTHCNMKKKELKHFKTKLQCGEGKVLCVCTYLHKRWEERNTHSERQTELPEKMMPKPSAHV